MTWERGTWADLIKAVVTDAMDLQLLKYFALALLGSILGVLLRILFVLMESRETQWQILDMVKSW